MTSNWRPSPTLQASAVLHVGAALGTVTVPAMWPWALGALLGNHAMITLAGLWPRSSLLGPNLVRLPLAARQLRQVALTFDDGPDPQVTPQVLDMLDIAHAKATFFCIGWRARAHPALCREIVARGHRVENHGDSHSHAFSLFGPRRMREDIVAAQSSLSDITGQAPLFFRPTAGLRNPFLDPVLHELGLTLASWTRRSFDTREGRPERVLSRLTRALDAGDILLMHDGHAAHTPQGQPVLLAVLPSLLETLQAHKLQPTTLQQCLT